MPISQKIDGEWKSLYSPYAKVDGEWRHGDLFVKVNGEWKKVYAYDVKPDDIIGFRMVYKQIIEMMHPHPNHPSLKPVDNLPVHVMVTGNSESMGVMDMTSKGIIFEFTNEHPHREGVCLYEGSLYAVTKDGFIFDVGSTKSSNSINDSKIPNTKVFNTERWLDMDIQIDTKITYQTFGFYIAGWNNFFTTTDFLDQDLHENHIGDEEYQVRVLYNLYPMEQRENDFQSIAQIGIARDMSTPHYNMVGAHGKLSQTITKILLNDQPKPFVVEVYD